MLHCIKTLLQLLRYIIQSSVFSLISCLLWPLVDNHTLVDQPLAIHFHQIVQVLPVRHYLATFQALPVALVIRSVSGPELSFENEKRLSCAQISEGHIDIALPMLCKWSKFRVYLCVGKQNISHKCRLMVSLVPFPPQRQLAHGQSAWLQFWQSPFGLFWWLWDGLGKVVKRIKFIVRSWKSGLNYIHTLHSSVSLQIINK